MFGANTQPVRCRRLKSTDSEGDAVLDTIYKQVSQQAVVATMNIGGG